MNRIIKLRKSRTLAALAGTSLALLVALAAAALAPSSLVRTAHAASAATDVNTQIAELHVLQATAHESLSYNGDPEVSAEHLDLFGTILANDATLYVADANLHFNGRAAILAFFAGTPTYQHDLVSLAPAFKTQFEVHGNSADVYYECHLVNPATDVVVAHRYAKGTAMKVNGRWVWQDLELGPASL